MPSERPNAPRGLLAVVGVLLFMVLGLTGVLALVVVERTGFSPGSGAVLLRGVHHVRSSLGRATRSTVRRAGLAPGIPDPTVPRIRRDLLVSPRGGSRHAPPRGMVPAAAGGAPGVHPAGGSRDPRRKRVSRDGRDLHVPKRLLERLEILRRHSERKALGDPDAPLSVVAYLDLSDPYSAGHVRRALPGLGERFLRTGTVLYRVRHRPLPNLHPRAVAVANAAECAARQGVFWRYALLALANRARRTQEDLIRMGRRAGVPRPRRFRRCVETRGALAVVKREAGAARRIGVRSTPTLRVGDRLLVGSPSLRQLQRTIVRLSD